MRNKWILPLIAILIGLIIYSCYLYNKVTKITDDNVINKVDSIETKIDTVYIQVDSLLSIVKESESVVKRVDNEYKNNYIRIVNESITDDIRFFTNYLISQNNRGLFNSNYSDSIKAN